MIEGPDSDYLAEVVGSGRRDRRRRVDSSLSVSAASPGSSGRISAGMRVHVMGCTKFISLQMLWAPRRHPVPLKGTLIVRPGSRVSQALPRVMMRGTELSELRRIGRSSARRARRRVGGRRSERSGREVGSS